MKWVIIKGVRYSSSVISAFAAYNMDNPFLKVRIRNKYHIVSFDDVNKMASQMVYLMNNYPDFVEIGRWWISKKTVMSWVPLILGGTNCDESYLDGVFGCLGNEKFYVCQPISLYKTTRNIHERPALYAFKIATEYFRAHGMVPVFENSHCKLMRL